MELLQDYELICIYWTKYYSLQNPVIADFVRKQLKRERYWVTALSKSGRKGREAGVRCGLRQPVGRTGCSLIIQQMVGILEPQAWSSGCAVEPKSCFTVCYRARVTTREPQAPGKKVSLLLRDMESASGTPPKESWRPPDFT